MQEKKYSIDLYLWYEKNGKEKIGHGIQILIPLFRSVGLVFGSPCGSWIPLSMGSETYLQGPDPGPTSQQWNK